MNKTKVICVVVVVLLMIAFICAFMFGKGMGKENKQVASKNVVTNTQTKNVVNEAKNEIAQNAVENVEVENTIKNETEQTTSTETFTEAPQTSEEKALAIVKKDWKSLSDSYSVQGIDNNGNYIVQVTNSSTQVLANYRVNVSNGTFTKEEVF